MLVPALEMSDAVTRAIGGCTQRGIAATHDRSATVLIRLEEFRLVTSRRSWKTLVVSLLVGTLFLASARPSEALLDKTRFVAHLGVAYFAFHHFVMAPYQQGLFASGTPGRTGKLAKGGIALLFAVHEVKVAQRIASKSNDPLLQKLDSGVAGLAGSFATVGSRMKSGQFKPEDVQGLNGMTQSVSSQAAASGAVIKDVPVAVPGT